MPEKFCAPIRVIQLFVDQQSNHSPNPVVKQTVLPRFNTSGVTAQRCRPGVRSSVMIDTLSSDSVAVLSRSDIGAVWFVVQLECRSVRDRHTQVPRLSLNYVKLRLLYPSRMTVKLKLDATYA